MHRRVGFGLLGICALLRGVSLVRPCLSDDEAIYAVVGREMLAGRMLYKDVVDHKPPAIYVVNEIAQAIGGPIGGMLLLHILLIATVWLTALVLAKIAERQRGGTGVFAALLWIVFTTTLVDCDSLAANCELFMMLPLCASVYVFVSSRKPAALALAGALVGVAVLFKYQAAIQLVVFACASMISRAAARRRIAELLLVAAGFVAPLLAAAVWLATIGALHDAWFWFQFNFSYIAVGSTSARLADILVRAGFSVAAAAPLYVLAYRSAGARGSARGLVVGWAIASALAICVGGRFFGHYFHQLTAPLAVLAAPAAAELWARRRLVLAASLAIPATVFLVLAIEHDGVMELAGEPDPDYAGVAAWLDADGAPGDALCVWGNSPVLYFEAQRPLGCRFVFSNYITGLSPATPSQTDPNVDSAVDAVPEAWWMMQHDLAVRHPRYIVDGSVGDVGYYGKYPPSAFPLGRILACEYQEQAIVAGMRIYRRLDRMRCKPELSAQTRGSGRSCRLPSEPHTCPASATP